jgi:hypothetical protein
MKSIGLLFAAGICLAGQVTSDEAGSASGTASIRGKVVNAMTGQPLRSLPVEISGQGGDVTVFSDADGSFAADHLRPGFTHVSTKSKQFPGILGIDVSSALVEVKAGEPISDVVIKLVPAGSISGTVRNDHREPVQDCAVQAISKAALATYGRQAWNHDSTPTDDQGHYRISGLQAGRYFVTTVCNESLPVRTSLSKDWAEPRESWEPVFYPDSSGRFGAGALTLMPGAEMTGIDFQLRRTAVGSLHGKLRRAAGRPDLVQLEANRKGSEGGDDFATPDQFVQADSETFDIQYVLPGLYELRASSGDWNRGTFSFGGVDAKVDSKQNEPVVLEMKTGLAVRGQLVVSDDTDTGGSAATKGTSVVLEWKAGGRAMSRFAEVAEDGTFLLTALFPGRWQVSVRGRERKNVQAVEMGARQMEGSEIEIAEGDTGLLKIMAGRAGGGTVAGVLEGAGSGGGGGGGGGGERGERG